MARIGDFACTADGKCGYVSTVYDGGAEITFRNDDGMSVYDSNYLVVETPTKGLYISLSEWTHGSRLNFDKTLADFVRERTETTIGPLTYALSLQYFNYQNIINKLRDKSSPINE